MNSILLINPKTSTEEPVIQRTLSPLPKNEIIGPPVFILILSDSYSKIPVEPSTQICLLPVISISGCVPASIIGRRGLF